MNMQNSNLRYLPNQSSSSEDISKRITSSSLYRYGVTEFTDIDDRKGVDDMADNGTFNVLISKIIQDQSDMKRDIAASEERTSARVAQVEDRMDQRLNRIEDMLTRSSDRTDSKIDAMEAKLAAFETKIETKITGLETKVDGNNKFIVGITVSTIIGIAAMVITVVFTALQLSQIVIPQ